MRTRWHVCIGCGQRFPYRYDGSSTLQELHGIDFVCGRCLEWALRHPAFAAERVASAEIAPGVAIRAPWSEPTRPRPRVRRAVRR
jgi:hypothetical protein